MRIILSIQTVLQLSCIRIFLRRAHFTIFALRFNNEAPFYVSEYGGPVFVDNGKEFPIWQAGPPFQITLLQTILNGNILQTSWKAVSAKKTIVYTYRFSITGKTLRIDISSDTPEISQINLDRTEATPNPRVLNIPYLTTMNFLFFNNHFVSAYFDWTQSQASEFDAMNHQYSGQSAFFSQIAQYNLNTNGIRNPVHEIAYITVSDSLHEVLPNIPNPPSPYRQVLAGRVILDLWGDPFAQDAELLSQLKQAGITNDLLVIKHTWQKCGYDNCYPSVIPANDDMGGDAGLIQLSNAARDAGYLFALHENYVDFYQNSDIWNPKYVALDSNSNQILAWYNPSTQIQSYRLSPASALNFAIRFSPWIHSRYGTTAVYLDGNSASPPSYFEDYNALVDGSAEQITTFKAYAQLLAYERLTHNGPVLGEGDNHFMYAGLVDGVEAQFEDLDYTKIQPIVDFDLLKIHPLAVNHGMGYYERFFGTAGGDYQQRFDFSDFNPEDFYMYMSTEIAFCHAGFCFFS